MIEVSSEPCHGATFEVYLPADGRPAAEAARAVERRPTRGTETILVAEDEPAVRQAVVEALRGAGYRTIEVADGRDAVRCLREHPTPVHLVLLDVIMPHLDGPETWEQLKRLRPELRVLFASGYSDDHHQQRLPANAQMLRKPFRMQALLEQVRATLDE